MEEGKAKDLYKYCIVSGCKITTIKNPGKRFLVLPRQENRRRSWLIAAKIHPKSYSGNSRVYVCEDHFNFEDDAENYIRLKYHESERIKFKLDVVPHIFRCQPERTQAQPVAERPSSAKRARKSLVEGLIASAEYLTPPVPTTPPLSPSPPPSTLPSPRALAAAETSCEISIPKYSDQESQTVISVRNKLVQARPNIRSKFVQCDLISSKKTITGTRGTSPVKMPAKEVRFAIELESDDNASPSSSAAPSVYHLSSVSPGSSTYNSSTDDSEQDVKYTGYKLKRSLHIVTCAQDSMNYLGVPQKMSYLIDTLAEYSGSEKLNIFICLQKIRQNPTFKTLGDSFEVSESFVSKVFFKVIPQMAKCMSNYVFWPHKEEILLRLPTGFRARYSHVQSIIDCFEIEIEKPSNPVHQTLSWSLYKGLNTMKYLISSTPDGFINFVSVGFGGRISDCKITEQSGFLDVLPINIGVMADRGFKGIAKLLAKKQCVLVRPPSVKSDEKSSKDEVCESKRIASHRIHIERIIRRLRAYDFLKPHSCVNHNLIKYLDCIVTTACGLVNFQNPLIKKCV